MVRRVFDKPSTEVPLPNQGEAVVPRVRRAPLAKGGAAAPRYIQGSVQSASDRSHQDIPLDQIQDSPIADRIDVAEDLEQLIESLATDGQKIPIIVRIVNDKKPYEIVVGRRRLAAMRHLGRSTIQGFITRLDDREAFRIQGIENADRLETSFIERARVAAIALDRGMTQEDVARFVAVSQPLVSAMQRIYRLVGEDLVLAIGAARGVGRRKWDDLAKVIKEHDVAPHKAIAMVDRTIPDSPARFENLLVRLKEKPAAGAKPRRSTPDFRHHADGRVSSRRRAGQVVVKVGQNLDEEFLDFLAGEIDGLVETYLARKEDSK